ncbi:MAG: cyclic nucleotide-binding domain-containing protein [Armatimonadetes bacterium]|nr:cyclic nucleotide-binding domain-containing protein [Armatimonadota bacterium]
MTPDEYLQDHHLCTLATATKMGTPHASTFWYANDGLDLYLALDGRSTTARNLGENPYVAGAIYDDTPDAREARSLHFQGRAVELTTAEERGRAHDVFRRKFPETQMPDAPTVRWLRIVLYDLRSVESGGAQEGRPTFFAVNFREDLVHQVFRGVTPAQAQEIASQLAPKDLGAGEVLFRQGTRGETFFIIVTGEVEVFQEVDGREHHIAVLGPGAFVGEMALLTGQPRIASVRARTPCRLVALDSEDFRGVMDRYPAIRADFERVMRARIAEVEGSR